MQLHTVDTDTVLIKVMVIEDVILYSLVNMFAIEQEEYSIKRNMYIYIK
jgi:hypothetical protein